MKQWTQAWVVDFYCGSELVESKSIERAYAPTRWARNYVRTLQRRMKTQDITFSITAC